MDKNIKAFLSIVDTLNLTSAASNIGLTQPSITKRLMNLETEVGATLFIRHRRGMTLTAAGQKFLRRAQRIEQEYEQGREELRYLVDAGIDTLRIGAGPLFHLQYVAPVFDKLKSEYPSLKMDLLGDSNHRTIPLLIEGKLDLVLGVIEPYEPANALFVKPLTVVENGVILNVESKSALTKKLKPESLKTFPWVLYSDNKNNEQILIEYFSRNNLGAPNIDVRTTSFTMGLNLVRTGHFAMMAPIQLAPLVCSMGLEMHSIKPTINRLEAGVYMKPVSAEIPAISRFVELLNAELEST